MNGQHSCLLGIVRTLPKSARLRKCFLLWPIAVAAWALLPIPATTAEPDRAAIQREVEQVYARPEFNPSKQADWSWLLKWIAAFFQWLGSLYDKNPVLFWLLFLGCVLLLVLIVGGITWTVRRAMFMNLRLKDPAGPNTEERLHLSSRYRSEADVRARAGEFTEAVRLLFLSLVYAFEESGQFLFKNSLTNREYLGIFASRPVVERNLRVFVDLLDANWYGQHPTRAEQFQDCLELYDKVRWQG